MRVITLWQPWATLMAIGAKTFETRHWSTPYRGELGIHAGATLDKESLLEPAIQEALGRAGYTKAEELPSRAILCVVKLVGCHSTDMCPKPIVERIKLEFPFGNYSGGRFAWETRMVRAFKSPIPARGAQGFWNWPFDWRAFE